MLLKCVLLLHLGVFLVTCICISLAAIAIFQNYKIKRKRMIDQTKALSDLQSNMKELIENLEVSASCHQNQQENSSVHVDQNKVVN